MSAATVTALREAARACTVAIGSRWSPQRRVVNDRASELGIYSELNPEPTRDGARLQMALLPTLIEQTRRVKQRARDLSKQKRAPWWKRAFTTTTTEKRRA